MADSSVMKNINSNAHASVASNSNSKPFSSLSSASQDMNAKRSGAIGSLVLKSSGVVVALGLLPACASNGPVGSRAIAAGFSGSTPGFASAPRTDSTQPITAFGDTSLTSFSALSDEHQSSPRTAPSAYSFVDEALEDPILDDTPNAPSGWEFGLDAFAIDGISFSAADIENGSGDASVIRNGGEIAVEAEHSSGLEFELGVSYLNEDWDFGGAGTGLVPGVNRPWKGFEKTGVELSMTKDFGKDWTLFAQVGYEDAAEIDVSTSDAGLYEGVLAFNKQFSEDFGLRFGLFYGDNHEESGDIIPLIGFDWKISDKDRLSLDRPRTGYGLMYTRTVTDSLALSTFFTTSGENYRLATDGPLPGGAIESDEFLFGASVDWQTGPGVISAYGGMTMGRDYTVFNSSGDVVTETSLDDGTFFGLSYQIGM